MNEFKNQKIIALTGKARSGKDTVADILVKNYNFTKIALADKIRQGLLDLDPYIPVKNNFTRLSNLINDIGWEKAKDQYPEVRRLLQNFGTESGWKIHGELLWPKALEKTIQQNYPNQNIVISDLRFPAERQWAKDNDIIVIKIHRDNVENKIPYSDHISESGIQDPDIEIYNNGTIEDLEIEIKKSLQLYY